ncbi:MAG: hybrid sensor histidine kinase/response regulator [Xenococcaceae cyanobacterium MO_234.B1]|nr:hybrid sensor histidine kinase/response regulator [Xenococcaceae cyanobacterium MO_234.B1]
MNSKDNFPQNNGNGEQPITNIFDNTNQSHNSNSLEDEELEGLDDLWNGKKSATHNGNHPKPEDSLPLLDEEVDYLSLDGSLEEDDLFLKSELEITGETRTSHEFDASSNPMSSGRSQDGELVSPQASSSSADSSDPWSDLSLIDTSKDDTEDLLPFITETTKNKATEQDLETIVDLDFTDNIKQDLNQLEESILEEETPEDLDQLLELEPRAGNSVSDQTLIQLDSEPELNPDREQLDDLDNLLDEPEINSNLDDLDNLLDEPDTDSILGDLDNLLDEPEINSNLGNLDELLDEPDTDSILGDLDNLLDEPDTDSILDSLLESTAEISPPVNIPVPKPADVGSKPATPKVFEQTMRVSVRKLDNLNNMIGELVVKRNRLEEDQERIRRFLDNLLNYVQSLGEMGAKMHDLYERSLLEGALMASRQQNQSSSQQRSSSFIEVNESPEDDDELGALEMDRFTGFHVLSQDIIELIVRVREAASDIQFVVDETDKVTQSLRQVTTQLQEGMNSSRMVPFEQTTDRLPRAVRDISRQLNKQVDLKIDGKEVLIDKMIVENLYNPMTHLVNNAITHGIESPEKRMRLGKPATGTVHINAFIQGNQTVITVSDDGAGIDPERVKSKAVEKNLITWAQAQNLSQQEVYDFLFHPGFSTKDQADDFAGRGVGMDVVATDIKKIRGTISIESEVGRGTTFTIRLPLVLSICKALSCAYNNSRLAFPIDGVEDTREYTKEEIKTNANGIRCISWNNTLLPFQPLANLLIYNRRIGRGSIYNSAREDDTVSIVILRSNENLLAVEVDQVFGEQEIVIKQIEGPVPKPAGIAGATVLGDGTIMPIGDVLELIEIAQGKRTIELGFNLLEEESGSRQSQLESITDEPMVLIVDDSITVRELLTLSFNKLGYRVEQARDGQEAWNKLRGGLPCDMIFCDIEMPRMNGLELLANLQKDEKLKKLPVAMLTSRGADKHRKLATDLGAKAYLTKPYTEKDLMDVAQKLIEINRANQEAELMVVNSKKTLANKSTKSAPSEVKNNPLVLIIDDSVTVRELLSMTFKKSGYRVEQARDGQEALEKLKGGLNCDIAFCDIEMPRMDGLELLANLQKDRELSSLPVAMLTSRGAQKMRNIAAKRGAKGYFVKPYVEDTLLDAAAKMMRGEILIEHINLDSLDN